MEPKIIKINLSNSNKSSNNTTNNKNNNNIPTDYVEINYKNLIFLARCWIKYKNIKTNIFHSGGMFMSFNDKIVILKTIRGELIECDINNNIFYCKTDTENYKALQEILLEKERIQFEKIKLKTEIKKYYELKKNLLDEQKKFYKEQKDFVLIKDKFNKLIFKD